MLFAAPLGCLLCHYHPAAGRWHEPRPGRAERARPSPSWPAVADEGCLPRSWGVDMLGETEAPQAMRPTESRGSANSSRRLFRLLAAPRAKWRALARSALRLPAVMFEERAGCNQWCAHRAIRADAAQ